MMYQFYDREHPKYDGRGQAKSGLGGEERSGRDPAAGRSIASSEGDGQSRPGDTLIVCSDHGPQSFRRGINLNNWLFEHGYLVLTELARGTIRTKEFVDWSRTRAPRRMIFIAGANPAGSSRPRRPPPCRPDRSRPCARPATASTRSSTTVPDGSHHSGRTSGT